MAATRLIALQLLPVTEQMEVLAQHTVTAVLLFAVLLRRRQFGNDGRPPLGLPRLQALIPHPEILRQLLGGSLGGEVEQLAHKVDHIPVLLTAEAVKPLIHLHAGRSVIMAPGGAGRRVGRQPWSFPSLINL